MILFTFSWCLTCGSVTKSHCVQHNHSGVGLTADSWKNLETLLSLKELLTGQQTKNHSMLAQAIDKRIVIQQYFSQLLKALEFCILDVTRLDQENEAKLAEMKNLMEDISSTTEAATDQEKHDLFVSNLSSLLENNEDTIETLKEKMAITTQSCEQHLISATDETAKIEHREKLIIKLGSTSLWDAIDGGFSVNWKDMDLDTSPAIVRDLFLISHLAFSVNDQTKKKESTETTGSKTISSDLIVDGERLVLTQSPVDGRWMQSLLQPTKDLLNSQPISHFTLTLFKHQTTTLGDILIKPHLSSPYKDFIQQLGDIKDTFSISIGRVSIKHR